MKIALLSDIHSNVYALDAIIKDVKKHGVDLMVNLGDILYGPIAPKATYELLMAHEFVTICGNQDRQIFQADQEEIEANPTMQFILADLDTQALDWMKALPFDKQLTGEVYLCHGTPNDDLIYLLEDVQQGYAMLRSDEEIVNLLNGQQSSLICCGHTHTPRSVSLSTGQLVVNPGSVGLQAYTDDEPLPHSMQNFTHHASYSIVESSGSQWSVNNIKVPYDYQLAINESKKRNRSDWVHFLSTGRCL
ncbi:metallophosphoesterase family protein [Colwellia psychrerythraea]|uniref:Calcineurin-like phosphoesterase superfamily domain containing protein n=1 Tax=Colwellia psychrerythraea TaxID=28229 RepID=A0A099KTB4_COLPS|nr:metallophosphoesterase family protein [Colwellia psychrerythraea]KGJ93776.1 Calcineurin-like phosphoesterase superfamily domain containing protein [Colwellia psychrerythraea]